MSNWAAAVGHDPYTSRAQLWRYKTGRAIREVTPWMTQGQQNEFRAITAVECDTGLWFDATGKENQQRHEILCPFATLVAYPDGVCETGSELVGLEVKCPQKLHEEVPFHYQIQLAGQFELCGFHRIIFASWSPAETRMWEVLPNEDLSNAVYPLLKKFAEYVHEDQEPPRLNRKPKLPKLKTERIG